MDIHNAELSYKQLLERYNIFNENEKQVTHEYKMKLELMVNMEQDQNEEYENLKKIKVAKLTEKEIITNNIKKQEMQVKKKHSEQLDTLKSKIEEAKLKNDELNKLLFKEKRKQTLLPNTIVASRKESDDKISTEKLKVQLKLNDQKNEELKNELELLKNHFIAIKTKINESEQNLQQKREQKQQYKIKIEDLIENNAVSKSKLESIKSKPLNQSSRGNSAFAEINDLADYLNKQKLALNEKIKNFSSDVGNSTAELNNLKEDISTVRKKFLAQFQKQVDKKSSNEHHLSSNGIKNNYSLSDQIGLLDESLNITKNIFQFSMKKFIILEDEVNKIAEEINTICMKK